MIKIFVSTKKTQGQRKNDFSFVPSGEVVIHPTFECDGETIDGGCGCRRSLSGISCHKATTTMVVAEKLYTVEKLAKMIEASMKKGGWGKLFSPERLTEYALADAKELVKAARPFRVGTVVERRGDTIQARKG